MLGIVNNETFILRIGTACQRGGREKRSGKREEKRLRAMYMMASMAMSPELSKGDERRIFFLIADFKFGLA